MKRTDFSYHLPSELIAQYPLAERSASRLLVLEGAAGGSAIAAFFRLTDFLDSSSLLVFNDTPGHPRQAVGAQVDRRQGGGAR
ncbi:MAG: S-adenosylmethionine:tRNA ribosyltransferase-isomerase [Halioglobus sp.]